MNFVRFNLVDETNKHLPAIRTHRPCHFDISAVTCCVIIHVDMLSRNCRPSYLSLI